MASEKILVIEDDPDVAYTCLRFLRKRYEPSHAPDCNAALSALGPAVKLIMLDLKMPGLKPAEFAKCAKQSFPAIPIIAMSGYLSSGLTLDIIKAGVYDFIHKPFELSDLEYIISCHLNGSATKETLNLSKRSITIVCPDKEEATLLYESLKRYCPDIESVPLYKDAFKRPSGRRADILIIERLDYEKNRLMAPGAQESTAGGVLTILLSDRVTADSKITGELVFIRPVNPFELRRVIAKTLTAMQAKITD